MAELATFLRSYIVRKSDHEKPKTNLLKNSRDYPASYYIPENRYQEFLRIYSRAFANGTLGEYACLTEQSFKIKPVIVDLDIKINDYSRFFTEARVMTVLRVYNRAFNRIFRTIDLSNGKAYVMVRPEVSPVDADKYKDGLHIVFPGLIADAETQHMIRKEILMNLFKEADFINYADQAESIVDKGVIDQSPWMLYGSAKFGGTPYQITSIHMMAGTEIHAVTNDIIAPADLPMILSVANKKTVDATALSDYALELKNSGVREQMARIPVVAPISYALGVNSDISEEKFEVYRQCVAALDPSRYTDYDLWIRVGWCLASITKRDTRGFKIFDDFSRQILNTPHYEKYDGTYCMKIWHEARIGDYSEGTLFMWVREDNPAVYEKVMSSILKYKILTNSDYVFGHYQFAELLRPELSERFLFAPAGKDRVNLYVFYRHTWKLQNTYSRLHDEIRGRLIPAIKEAIEYVQKRSVDAAGADDASEKKRSSLIKLLASISSATYIRGIDAVLSDTLLDEEFADKQDKNQYLIAFANGVYDLKTEELRDGRPEDFITAQYRYDYIPYDKNSIYARDIKKFLRDIMPNKAIRVFLKNILAATITGNIDRDPRVFFAYGGGANGKSKLFDLIFTAFAHRYSKVNKELFLYRANKSSDNATTELNKLVDAFIGNISEIEKSEVLNLGLVKDLTGAKQISYRKMYSEASSFEPKLRLFFETNNLPRLKSTNYAEFRRIRVIPFESKFMYKTDPNWDDSDPNVHEIDVTLDEKIEIWGPHFMSYLIDRWTRVIKRDRKVIFRDPKEVLFMTEKFIASNDCVARFFMTRVRVNAEEYTDDYRIHIDKLYQTISRFVDSRNIVITRDDIVEYISKQKKWKYDSESLCLLHAVLQSEMNI